MLYNKKINTGNNPCFHPLFMSDAASRFSPQIWRAGVPLIAGLLIAVWPAPAGLAPHAWLYFALFAAVILALITEPLPPAAVGLIGVTVIAVFGFEASSDWLVLRKSAGG